MTGMVAQPLEDLEFEPRSLSRLCSRFSLRSDCWLSIFLECIVNKEVFDKGLKVRREVLGSEYVDNALKNADEFSMPLQEFVTEFAWAGIWTRPGLDRRQRSMLNLGMLAALNRPHEMKIHIRGAINNGVTKQEIAEVFLQAGMYCGAPAAVDSFRLAREVFAEMKI